MSGKVESGGFNPDKFASEAERYLSEKARTPIIGSLAGAAKIVGGGAQFITAFAVGILGIPMAVAGNTTLLKHSWTHLQHGIGNIAAGIFETIPGGGTLLGFIRENINIEKPNQTHVVLGEKDKFMPYDSVAKEESKIVAGVADDDEHRALAQEYYNTMAKGKNLSGEEMFTLRKEAIRYSISALKEFKEKEKMLDLEHLDKKEDKPEKDNTTIATLKNLKAYTPIKISISNDWIKFHNDTPTQFNFYFLDNGYVYGQDEKRKRVVIHASRIQSVEVLPKKAEEIGTK